MMYAHQVIEDFESKKDFIPFEQSFISCIRSSQKFSFESQKAIQTPFLNTVGKSRLFYDDCDDLRFPYSYCWFDYSHSTGDGLFGTLVEYNDKNREFQALFFLKNLKQREVTGERPRWLLDPCGVHIKIGSFFKGYKSNVSFAKIWDVDGEFDASDYGQKHMVSHISFLEMALKIMNCKNIAFEIKYPDTKLNKARKSKNRQPLFTYHTLVIKPTKKISGGGDGLYSNRIHLCRGHFKNYTKENPLFGRLTGRYWWQPHIRGNKKLGFVHKDYEVKAA